jgi:hypothetical protein
VFQIHYGKRSLKIDRKGECVLRSEGMVPNAADTPFGRGLMDFPKTVACRRSVLERFLNTLRCVEAGFIADDTLERLPEASFLGARRVGGVDFNRPRRRLLIQAVLALSTAPTGFTAGELAATVRPWGGPSANAYTSRPAAYAIQKLRAQPILEKPSPSNR